MLYKGKWYRYIPHFPIHDHKEAKVLAGPTNWKIVDLIREHGPDGVTQRQIAKELGLHIVTPYSKIKLLEGEGYIVGFRKPRVKAELFTMCVERVHICYDETFHDLLVEAGLIERDFRGGKLLEKLVNLVKASLTQTIEEVAKDLEQKSKDVLPQKDCECPVCHRNHDAEEFFYALLTFLIHSYMDTDEFRDVCKKLGYFLERKH